MNVDFRDGHMKSRTPSGLSSLLLQSDSAKLMVQHTKHWVKYVGAKRRKEDNTREAGRCGKVIPARLVVGCLGSIDHKQIANCSLCCSYTLIAQKSCDLDQSLQGGRRLEAKPLAIFFLCFEHSSSV